MPFSNNVLQIDAKREVDKICRRLREILAKDLKRRGLVVALSGGIDSSVTVGLAAKAIGPERVLALLMPERHSSDDTLDLSQRVADTFKVPTHPRRHLRNILEAVGFYQTL
jgi:NAD+ synthase